MTPTKSIWYRLGYALEQAREGPSTASRSLKSLAERTTDRKPAKRSDGSDAAGWTTAENLITAGAAAAVAKVLDAWSPARKPGFTRIVRAGAAGAAAALIVDLLRPLLRGDVAIGQLDENTGDRVLAGFGQGLVYGAIVEPRVPGHWLIKGALYGSAEYAVDPVGGLGKVLGGHAPQRKLPVVGSILDGLKAEDRDYVDHVTFGITLAALCGSSRNGVRIEVENG